MTISIATRATVSDISGRLLDPKEVHDYKVQIAENTGQLRIQHINVSGEVISHQTLDADEAYHLATQILKGYDRLEGL